MPYIGKNPVGGGFHKLDALTASATATYALTLNSAAYFPETANQLLVSLNGVIQAPQDSFTVSGSNLVFDTALTASDSIDFVVALGDVLSVGSVTDGAITTAKLGNGAVTDAKIDTMAATKLTGTISDARFAANMPVQIITNTFATELNLSTSFQDTGLYATITPKYSNSKILVQWCINYQISDTGANLNIHEHLFRNSTRLNPVSDGIKVLGGYNAARSFQTSSWVDEPSTTSAITYKIQAKEGSGDAGVAHENDNPSIMILTEIKQ